MLISPSVRANEAIGSDADFSDTFMRMLCHLNADLSYVDVYLCPCVELVCFHLFPTLKICNFSYE